MEDHLYDCELMDQRWPRRAAERRSSLAAFLAFASFVIGSLTAAGASAALAVTLDDPGPSVVGEPVMFAAKVTGATGAVTYTWTQIDQSPVTGGAEMAFTFGAVGHVFSAATVEVRDDSGATASDGVSSGMDDSNH